MNMSNYFLASLKNIYINYFIFLVDFIACGKNFWNWQLCVSKIEKKVLEKALEYAEN